MNKRIISAIMATLFAISALSFSSFATNNTGKDQKWQGKERPQNQFDFQKQENVVIGKITAISENSVTISIAEFKKPDNNSTKNDFKPPEKPANDNNNSSNNSGANNSTPPNPPSNDGEMPQLSEEQLAEMKKNIENMYTLTGETKTIDISSATFDDFRKREKKSSDNNSNNNLDNNQKNKTYKDYNVGDYISIELESSTSTKAKSVRSTMMPFGHRGFDMKPKDDSKQNNK